jgi:hypothetical protein
MSTGISRPSSASAIRPAAVILTRAGRLATSAARSPAAWQVARPGRRLLAGRAVGLPLLGHGRQEQNLRPDPGGPASRMKGRGCARLRLDSLTHKANAGSGGAFLLADGAVSFELPPAGVHDPHTGNLDLPPTHPHGLLVRRSEALEHQVRYHIHVESMGEQICPGAAAQPCIGKHFERPPLFCAKVNPRQISAPSVRVFRPIVYATLRCMPIGAAADREQCYRPAERHTSSSRIMVALRSDLAPEQQTEALRIERIGFASAGTERKPKEAIAA